MTRFESILFESTKRLQNPHFAERISKRPKTVVLHQSAVSQMQSDGNDTDVESAILVVERFESNLRQKEGSIKRKGDEKTTQSHTRTEH